MRVKTLVTKRMKVSPAKSIKTAVSKKRIRNEASDAGKSSLSSPRSAPLTPEKQWKKAKLKTEDKLTLVNSGFLREKEMDLWRTATGHPYPMEKNPDEVSMFTWFVECRLALPTSDFFKGMLRYHGIEYVNLKPNIIFHISVFTHFFEAFMGIKRHWILFRKCFRLKPQPSADVVWTPLGPLLRWVPGPTNRWAPKTTHLGCTAPTSVERKDYRMTVLN
jgi:hypothetical protein